MSEILQTNIFFIITSIAVVVFTLLLSVAVYHVIKILRSIRRIVERVDQGSEVIAEDVSQLRAYVTEGSLVSQVMSFVFGAATKKGSRTKKKDTPL